MYPPTAEAPTLDNDCSERQLRICASRALLLKKIEDVRLLMSELPVNHPQHQAAEQTIERAQPVLLLAIEQAPTYCSICPLRLLIDRSAV